MASATYERRTGGCHVRDRAVGCEIGKAASTVALGANLIATAKIGEVGKGRTGRVSMAATGPLGVLGGVTGATVAAGGLDASMMEGLNGSSTASGASVTGQAVAAKSLFAGCAADQVPAAVVTGLATKTRMGLTAKGIGSAGSRCMADHAGSRCDHGVVMGHAFVEILFKAKGMQMTRDTIQTITACMSVS